MKTRPMALMTSARLPFWCRPASSRGPACLTENSRGDQPRGALDEHQRLALIPRVIAERHASAPASISSW